MRKIILLSVIFTLFFSCVPVEVPRPKPYISLYELREGKTIKVIINQISRNQGRITSIKSDDETFQGEYYLHETQRPIYPVVGIPRNSMTESIQDSSSKAYEISLPERFGFGKDNQAQPVGSGVLLGSKGTVIEIIFYHLSSNLYSGDGIARDNKGRFYRIFLGED